MKNQVIVSLDDLRALVGGIEGIAAAHGDEYGYGLKGSAAVAWAIYGDPDGAFSAYARVKELIEYTEEEEISTT